MMTRREANGRRLWRGFQEIATELHKHGVPMPSDRWMQEVERFYLHPTATQWLACVGRGGGKNLVGLLCDLTELIFGRFTIPAGERHYHVHVSENRTEAEKTLRQAAQYLKLLGIPHTATVDTIELEGELADRGEKVQANRIGAVSGFRATGGTLQEPSKWNDEGVNPTEEIVTSWNAQMVTHSRARRRLFSTPMTRDDYFWSLVERGDTADQIVTQGASWEFNPSISEEMTRKLAPSVAIFDREYRAIPSAARSAAFIPDAVDRAFKHPQPDGRACQRRIIMDPSSGKKDAFTYADMGWVVPHREGPQFRPYLRVNVIESIGDSFWGRAGGNEGDEIADSIAAFARARNCTHVHSDQREELFLRSAIQKRKLTFTVHTWTGQSKPLAVERVRRWFAEGDIAICAHERMRRELLSFEEKITASGAFTYGARGGKHDDFVALLLTAAMAKTEGYLTPSLSVDWKRMNRSAPNPAIDSRDMSSYDGRGPRAPHAQPQPMPVSYAPPTATTPGTWTFGPGARKPPGGGGGGGGSFGGGFGDYG